MSQPAIDALGAQLGVSPPAGLGQLSDEQLCDLAGAVEQARRRQGAALAEAGDKAYRSIPRLLRGPIRRILG